MMKFSQPCSTIVKQFAHAQDMCVSPKKSKQNQHLKNHYSTLPTLRRPSARQWKTPV